jgi:hypothetical protein
MIPDTGGMISKELSTWKSQLGVASSRCLSKPSLYVRLKKLEL